jgi:hypothetical protein
MKKTFYNTFWFGITTGILIQALAFFFILVLNKSLIGYTERSAFEFLNYLLDYEAGTSEVIPKLLSLAAIADLALFFLYIWTEQLKSARGVIASALILGLVIVYLKFF